jgi:hypothetical protein
VGMGGRVFTRVSEGPGLQRVQCVIGCWSRFAYGVTLRRSNEELLVSAQEAAVGSCISQSLGYALMMMGHHLIIWPIGFKGRGRNQLGRQDDWRV